jgi:hypothetical protein
VTAPARGAAAPDDLHVHAWFDAPPPREVAGSGDDVQVLRRRLLRSEARCVHVDRVAVRLSDAGFDVERPVPPNAVGGAVEVREDRARARVGVTWVWVPGTDHRSWLAWTAPVHRRGRRGTVAHHLAAALRPHLHAALDADPDVAWVRWLTEDEARATEL